MFRNLFLPAVERSSIPGVLPRAKIPGWAVYRDGGRIVLGRRRPACFPLRLGKREPSRPARAPEGLATPAASMITRSQPRRVSAVMRGALPAAVGRPPFQFAVWMCQALLRRLGNDARPSNLQAPSPPRGSCLRALINIANHAFPASVRERRPRQIASPRTPLVNYGVPHTVSPAFRVRGRVAGDPKASVGRRRLGLVFLAHAKGVPTRTPQYIDEIRTRREG